MSKAINYNIDEIMTAVRKPVINATDVCKILLIGKNKAYRIIKEINAQIIEEKRLPLPNGKVATTRLLEHFNLKLSDFLGTTKYKSPKKSLNRFMLKHSDIYNQLEEAD